MTIVLDIIFSVGAMLFTLGILGIFSQPQEHHRHPDVDRAGSCLRSISNLVGVSTFLGDIVGPRYSHCGAHSGRSGTASG